MAEQYELKYERAATYKTATVDGVAVSVIGDAYGARINLSFTRIDTKPISETVMKEGNQLSPFPIRPPRLSV